MQLALSDLSKIIVQCCKLKPIHIYLFTELNKTFNNETDIAKKIEILR